MMKLLVLVVCVYAVHGASLRGSPAKGQKGNYELSSSSLLTATASANVKPSLQKDNFPTVLRSVSDVGPEGFNYLFETSDGINSEAVGDLKTVNDVSVLVLRGSYSYVDPLGQKILVSYVADENGYQPQSDILPVAPPTPEAILKALEYIKAHPSTTEEKQY